MNFRPLLLVFSCLSLYSGTAGGVQCPNVCRCSIVRHSSNGVITDCSHAALHTAPVTQMSPNTVSLDLSNNLIQHIQTDAFSNLKKLQTLILNDNLISVIDVNAFSGLNKLRNLELKRNRIQTLKSNSLSRVAGDSQVCRGGNSTCVLDLSENGLELIEGNALAWIKRLAIVLGDSKASLAIEPYAFYGIEDVPTIKISNIPALILHRHAITNAEGVGRVEIVNTRLANIHNFTFQGLEDVGAIVLHNCEVSTIKTLAFAAVRYQPVQETLRDSDNKTIKSGGVFNMSYCRVRKLESDIFRDTNLAHIYLTGNKFYNLGEHVFRGLANLRTFWMMGNTLDSLPPNSLSSLSNLDELVLDRNHIDLIEGRAFAGTQDIGLLRLTLKLGTNLTLDSHAFSEVLEITHFEIIGSVPLDEEAPYTKPALIIHQDAFSSFVAQQITIANVSLPNLKQNSFRGLSKVGNLSFVSCDINSIETATFGDSYGGVYALDITAGSQLPCNCETRKLMGELKKTFTEFQVNCVHPEVVTLDKTHHRDISTMDWGFCNTQSGAVDMQGHALLASLILFFITLVIL